PSRCWPRRHPPRPDPRRLPRRPGRAEPVLDGRLLVDAHVHVARLPTLAPDWHDWAAAFGAGVPVADLHDAAGTPVPAAIDAHFASQGVDHVLLFSEYSPKATGVQPVEDLLPVVAAHPGRFHLVASINPHLHYPPAVELARQVSLGAVACKIHPVHGGFAASDRMLYPAYSWAQEHGLPVIVHCGTSTFAGSSNAYADPVLLDPVFRDFPGLTVVLAHGGRGWWYDQAAFLALMLPQVWLEISGLPPQRLPDYYGAGLRRLASKMIFGTDWPGVPGVARNARAVEQVLLAAGCPAAEVAAALGGNAARVFSLG
ncbi:MAG: amidohydrolase family protein, partial [Streptosporangiaceae bacterium]